MIKIRKKNCLHLLNAEKIVLIAQKNGTPVRKIMARPLVCSIFVTVNLGPRVRNWKTPLSFILIAFGITV